MTGPVPPAVAPPAPTPDRPAAARPPRVHREVVSYVRRSARMRPNQRQALDRHQGDYVVEVPQRETSTSIDAGARLDLPAVFGRRAPLVVEVGPGTGEALVPLAAARPDVDVLAFEVYEPAVAQLVGGLARAGVTNVRVVVANAVEGLRLLVPPDSVSELWTFFPDPWPKARHHKRRLVGPETAALVASRLRPGGVWRLATDWEDYALSMRAVLAAEPGLVDAHPEGWAPRWADRPVTRFEQRGLDAGRVVRDLTYARPGPDRG